MISSQHYIVSQRDTVATADRLSEAQAVRLLEYL
jgi:hypothetical protein